MSSYWKTMGKIFEALECRLVSRDKVCEWLNAENDAEIFGGRAPLDVIDSGGRQTLERVLQYVKKEEL